MKYRITARLIGPRGTVSQTVTKHLEKEPLTNDVAGMLIRDLGGHRLPDGWTVTVEIKGGN